MTEQEIKIRTISAVFPPSPTTPKCKPNPPYTHPTNDHRPHLCTPVEQHRHPEGRRLVSKMCNSESYAYQK